MLEAILYALAEWSIRAAVLAGTVGALLWAARIKDAHVKLSAWTIVLVAILLMPLAAPVTPRLTISLPAFISKAEKPRLESQQKFHLPVLVHANANPQKAFAPRAADFATAFWMLIALVMLSRLALGLRLGARLVQNSRPLENQLRESELVRVPITVGVLHPKVILPSDWRDWPQPKLRAVLAHEQAHVARQDPLRLLAASIYRSVAWFHPLAWWLRAELAELAEQASDDAAIAAGEDRVKYAEALLSFIERTPRRVQWEGVTEGVTEGVNMANRQTRMRRIDRVLDQNRRLSQPSNYRTIAALTLAVLPLIYIATATQPVRAQAPTQSSPASATVCGGNPAYTKWLNEDVAYIITQEEHQAFERLRDAAECSQFVEQFWLRRDSAFKEEHYRRIAYANQHFASTNPGWKTDRGRIYITYGPPDEIDSHPAGERTRSGETYPFDQWRYTHNASLGDDILLEFVDSTGDNEYRLTLMGGPSDLEALRGKGEGRPAVFGPISGLYVEVNHNGTIFITTPVRGSSSPVTCKIVDRNGAIVQSFDDVSRSGMYGKWVVTPLPAGQYVLHLDVDHNLRALTFEVK
jgi:GWxTD domain-containing protein